METRERQVCFVVTPKGGEPSVIDADRCVRGRYGSLDFYRGDDLVASMGSRAASGSVVVERPRGGFFSGSVEGVER